MNALWAQEVPGGVAWSALVRRGRVMKLTALSADVNCSMLIFAAVDLVDRLNVPDTLKAQMSARIRPPMVLMSDRGVGLASVTGSSLDWHDCLGGLPVSDLWRLELAKHGRGQADLHACVNFFSKVATADDGRLVFVAGHSSGGDWVTLRAEVDLLIVLSTAAHPMGEGSTPGGVRIELLEGARYGADDPSMAFRDESARALEAARVVFA